MIREATVDDKFRLVEMTTRFILETEYLQWLAGATPERIGAYVDDVLKRGIVWLAHAEVSCSMCGHRAFIRRHCPVCTGSGFELKAVGMLAFIGYVHPLTGKFVGEELAWWVEPEHRNGLAGPRLEAHMLRWCAQNSVDMVKMVAPAGSSVGDFYSKRGYQALETHWIKVLTDGSDDISGDRGGPRRRPASG